MIDAKILPESLPGDFRAEVFRAISWTRITVGYIAVLSAAIVGSSKVINQIWPEAHHYIVSRAVQKLRSEPVNAVIAWVVFLLVNLAILKFLYGWIPQ